MLPMTKAIEMAIHFSGPPAIIRTPAISSPHDDGLIAGRSQVRDRFMQLAAEIVVTADALAADKGLGRYVDAFAP